MADEQYRHQESVRDGELGIQALEFLMVEQMLEDNQGKIGRRTGVLNDRGSGRARNLSRVWKSWPNESVGWARWLADENDLRSCVDDDEAEKDVERASQMEWVEVDGDGDCCWLRVEPRVIKSLKSWLGNPLDQLSGYARVSVRVNGPLNQNRELAY